VGFDPRKYQVLFKKIADDSRTDMRGRKRSFLLLFAKREDEERK